MAGVARLNPTIDPITLLEAIRGVLARSPIFHKAAICPPVIGTHGEVTVQVTFPAGTPALRVTAPSDQEAYAILHELASAIVENAQNRRDMSQA